MLSAIFASLGGHFIDGFLDNALKAFTAYQSKQISMEELKTQLRQHFFDMIAHIETAYADSINKTFATFMQAATQSRLIRYVWAIVTLSQLIVLLWHQMGIPALVYFTGERYPSSGTTVDWAYLLLAGCVGFGAVTLRGGGAGSSTADSFKNLLGK
jgi:hypothetical protein